jgi:hypothetical protein
MYELKASPLLASALTLPVMSICWRAIGGG